MAALTAWKDHERRVARALGGERSGPLGRHNSDAIGTPFAVECKRTTRYQLRSEWLTQARRQSKQEGKPWLLVISEHSDRNPIAVLDFHELVTIMAGASRDEPCSSQGHRCDAANAILGEARRIADEEAS